MITRLERTAIMEKQRTLPEPKQREITRLCMWAAQLLMQHGAESAQVEAVAVRLGAALGLENVQVGITANAISLTTVCEGHCITTVRRTLDHGINMHVVTEVQRTMLLAEAGKSTPKKRVGHWSISSHSIIQSPS